MSHCLLRIKVVPNSSRDQLVGWLIKGEVFKVKVQAPPEANKANKSLVKLFAKALNIPEKDIILEKGETKPEKVIRFENLTESDLFKKLEQ